LTGEPKTLYLDSSALMKLVRTEAESEALEQWLGERDVLVTSVIGVVEVQRGIERYSDRETSRLRWEIAADRLRVIKVSEATIESAATVPPAALKSLDAIHLATALVLKPELDAFVVYDRRLAEAAMALGLPVSSPGAAA